jgi:hypothetical protein
MKRIILSWAIVLLLVVPVQGAEMDSQGYVKEEYTYYGENLSSFWQDLVDVIGEAALNARPDLAEAARTCICIIAIALLCSVTLHYSSQVTKTVQLVLTISIGLLLLDSGRSLIELGLATVREISEHSKIILPVLTGALAAQGGTTKSIALHTGTAFFSTVLSAAVSKLLVPLLLPRPLLRHMLMV